MNGKYRNLVLMACISTLCLCGGGSDVGNPDIKGRVVDASGTPVINCMVVLGPRGCDPGRVDTISMNGGIVIVTSKPFDTVRTSPDGTFFFGTVQQGEYSLFASKDNLSGIVKVKHEQYFDSDTDIKIDFPAKLVFDNYSQFMDSLPNTFIAARISGTTITNDKNLSDSLFLDAVPAGFVDVILYRSNNRNEIISDLQVFSSSNTVVMVDPSRSQKYWTFMQESYREPLGRPYILMSTPVNGAESNSAIINMAKEYDVEIQFSHGMDTKKTGAALSAFSSDGRVIIDSVWWQGADVMRINLCSSDDTTMCVNDSLYSKKGVTYTIVVDTSARTNLGVNFAWPETLSFIPLP